MAHKTSRALGALRHHWPEYLMEAAGLGIFMVSACGFGSLLEYPRSPVHQAIGDPFVRRSLMGLAMGATAVAIIYSPWGQQSGAHINPAITLTFFRLGKIESWDALFYIVAQFLGGIAGVALSALALMKFVSHPAVSYVVTVPGAWGVGAAFVAEVFISLGLISMVLFSTNTPRLARLTGLFAGVLVGTYIAFEAPISGMSMNPARSFGSAVPAHLWTAFWIYLVAPPVGMLLGAKLYTRVRGKASVLCAKLNHFTSRRCIFRCGYHQATPDELA